MRKEGCITKAKCWNIQVINQQIPIFSGEYATLKDIAKELDISYNQVVELSSGRKRQGRGRFDTTYIFTKISSKKLNSISPEPQELS